MSGAADIRKREEALQFAALAWIVTGLIFMLLPGTFLGVWNLIAITGAHGAAAISPGWIQAHGHAQVFGWIGTFILGIGFYSLSKMARLPDFAISRCWISLALWAAGVLLRWWVNVYIWQWRLLMPLSATLELAAFLIFFVTVSGHRPATGGPVHEPRPLWITIVMASTVGFLLSLLANLGATIYAAVSGAGPALPHGLDQRLLGLFTWGFPVIAVWGFNARWLPVFLGLKNPRPAHLIAAVALAAAAVAASFAAFWTAFGALVIAAAALSAIGLQIFTKAAGAPKTTGVHPTFPVFVKLAYVWLLVAAILTLAAARWDIAGGLWGASRHALTVGFLAAMVFAIGQRVLPAFCGMRVLYSPKLMFASLLTLNLGCFLRVTSEIAAYENYAPALWIFLPISAITEMTAVTLFAANLFLTFRQPPAHLRNQNPRTINPA